MGKKSLILSPKSTNINQLWRVFDGTLIYNFGSIIIVSRGDLNSNHRVHHTTEIKQLASNIIPLPQCYCKLFSKSQQGPLGDQCGF